MSRRSKRPVHALLLTLWANFAVADGAPLAAAEKLLAAGNVKGVYELLAPHEFEYSGDPKFDLMFGYAALETGNASIASLAFERVLALEPNNPEARLHLARAYVALNDPNSAKREFETLLATNPTQGIRATVGQYLSALQATKPAEKLQLSGYLDGTVGYDSNINGATSRNPISIPIDPRQLELPNSSIQAESPFFTAGVGGTALYAFTPTLAGYAGADIISRHASRADNVDYLYSAARTGVWKQFKNQAVRGGLTASDFSLEGDSFRQSLGVEAEYRQTFAERLQGSVVGGFTANRHVPDASRTEDYDLYSLSASAVRLLGDAGQHVVSVAFDYGHEDALRARIDGNRDYYGLRLTGQYEITNKINAYGTLGYQYADYDRQNAVFAVTRNERQWNSAVGLNFRITPTFVIRPSVTWLDQSSNIPLYDYSRWTASLTMHVDFL